MQNRKRPRVIRGVVISDKMSKTRVIETRRTVQHGLYLKSQVRRGHIFVHDEKNESKTGDTIVAVASRPLSRHKSFRLVKVLQARGAE